MSQAAKTAVSLLEEHVAKNGGSLPKYQYLQAISISGGPNKKFYYEVRIGNISAVEWGPSKEAARQNTALKALELLEVGTYSDNINERSKVKIKNTQDSNQVKECIYTKQLTVLCTELKLNSPQLLDQYIVMFKCICLMGVTKCEATAMSSKEARQLASKSMLIDLGNDEKTTEENSKVDYSRQMRKLCLREKLFSKFLQEQIAIFRCACQVDLFRSEAITTTQKGARQLAAKYMLINMGIDPILSNTNSDINYIEELIKLCTKLKLSSPKFHERQLKLFQCECIVAIYKSEGRATEEKEAKQLASKNMLTNLSVDPALFNENSKFDYIEQVNTLCDRQKMSVRFFEKRQNAHKCECLVGEYRSEGMSKKPKIAKKLALNNMLKQLRSIPVPLNENYIGHLNA